MSGYRAFVDPAGGAIGGDSFALAIAHPDGEMAVLDLLFERPGPFSPPAVVEEIVAILREYGIGSVTGDKYSARWVVDSFATPHGIEYFASTRDKSQIFADFLPLATSGRARLLDNAKLIAQLSALERIAGAGRDRIDHPRGQHDDLANVAAGALTLAARREPEIPIVAPFIVDSQSAPVFDRWSARWWGEGSVPMPSQGDLVGGLGGVDTFTGTSAWMREQIARRGQS